MRSRSNSASRSTSAFFRAVKSANSFIRLNADAESSFDEILADRRRDLKNIFVKNIEHDLCYYLLDFFSRSGERDLCRCDEFPVIRSRDNLRCLCFLFDGLRDRPIVL
jgi:hypothetical protein